jgi:FAD/FMN-containing dehydrogenase
MPADAAGVADALRFAARRGLRVAPQRTGHNAGPLGDLRDALLLRTDALDGIEIDPDALRVRVGAATKWEQVVPRLSALGLAALHGSSPDVGIVGYSLGGGIGWLARRHGMQTNAVTAIELITADGELIRADHEHERELFWALRGGGGNFGVVTALEFEVFRVPELYAGALFFDLEQTADVLHAWHELLRTLPEELTSWASVIHFPPAPEVPEPVRGRAFAIVMAAFLGGEDEGRALLAPLRRLCPRFDTFAMTAPDGLSELAMDPRDPLPFASTHALVDALPVDDLARIAPSLTLLQLRHMGGALKRVEPGAGARATLPGEICVFGLAAGPGPHEGLDALDAAVRRVGEYPNFVEHPADAARFFDAETWARLRRVKAAYDPQDLFKANHHIPA